MSPGLKYHYGIFFGPYCAGVSCLSGAEGTGGVNVHKPFKVSRSELAILGRGACVHWAPTGTNSKLVSWSCRIMSRNTKIKIIIGYSDNDAGEIGTIYQACNWVYIGRGSSTYQFIAPNGRAEQAA